MFGFYEDWVLIKCLIYRFVEFFIFLIVNKKKWLFDMGNKGLGEE